MDSKMLRNTRGDMNGLGGTSGSDAHAGSLPAQRSETMRNRRASEAIARDLLHSACIFQVSGRRWTGRPLCRLADQAGGVEPVDAIDGAEMTRQGAQIALGGEHFGEAADLGGLDRHAAERHVALEEIGDLPRPFLDLERAGAIDQRAPWLDH